MALFQTNSFKTPFRLIIAALMVQAMLGIHIASALVAAPPKDHGISGVYVPVDDGQLNSQFYDYHSDFNTYANAMEDWIVTDPDSLKKLLGGPDPGGIAAADCATRQAVPGHDPLNFTKAAKDPNTDPNNVVSHEPWNYWQVVPLQKPQVNDSASLRCLLQELVEWKKLELNLTIHKMMKDFISDAQTFLLSKQLQTYIVAGLIDWSRSGIEMTLSPTQTIHTSAYVADPEQHILNTNSRLREGMLAQIGNNLSGGADAGFGEFEIYDNFRNQVARNVAVNSQDLIARNLETLPAKLKNTLDDTFNTKNGDVDNFAAGDFTIGGWDGYLNFVLNDQNNPLGATNLLLDGLDAQTTQSRYDQYQQLAYGDGFLPSTEQVDKNDPYARIQQVMTPASMNSRTVLKTVEGVGYEALSNADEYLEKPGKPAEDLQTVLTDSLSLRNYDPTALRTISPDLNSIYNQFWFEMGYGYYDIQPNTSLWAKDSLSSITDALYGYLQTVGKNAYAQSY